MGSGKKKIEIKKKEKECDRMVTFSKRKRGLFKKASQLKTMFDSQVAILLFSPAGHPHTNDSSFFDSTLPATYLSGSGASSGATTISEDDDASVLKWMSILQTLVEGEEGGDCSSSDQLACVREWFNSFQVDRVEKVEDLLGMKQRLENIRKNLMVKVEDAISSSYIA